LLQIFAFISDVFVSADTADRVFEYDRGEHAGRLFLALLTIPDSSNDVQSLLVRSRRRTSACAGWSSAQTSYIQKLDPINSLNSFSATKGIVEELANNNTSILITNDSEDNAVFARDITNIFNAGLYQWMFSHSGAQLSKGPLILMPPDQKTDVDAPKLSISNHSGIIVYGEGNMKDKIRSFLGNCFVVRKSRNSIAELATYYRRKVIWIELAGFQYGETESTANFQRVTNS
jgi:hypothetical protein